MSVGPDEHTRWRSRLAESGDVAVDYEVMGKQMEDMLEALVPRSKEERIRILTCLAIMLLISEEVRARLP